MSQRLKNLKTQVDEQIISWLQNPICLLGLIISQIKSYLLAPFISQIRAKWMNKASAEGLAVLARREAALAAGEAAAVHRRHSAIDHRHAAKQLELPCQLLHSSRVTIKPGIKMDYPEPCKELRRRICATLFGWDCPLLTFIYLGGSVACSIHLYSR